MTDDVYTRQNFGNQVGMGRKPALLIVDFQVGFADPEVFGGGNVKDAVHATIPLLQEARALGLPVAYTRAVFADVGPFRTVVSEDSDWSFRATAKGYRLIYEDGLRVSHPSRSDWAALRHKWHRLTCESFALQQTTRPGLSGRARWAIKALAMPISAFAHLPKLLLSPKLESFGERMRGTGTLFRLRFLRMIWMLRQAVGLDI